jgi:hypothetical protein
MANAQIYDKGDGSSLEHEGLDSLNDPMLQSIASLEDYVLWKTREWEEFIESNFYSQWDEYYRIWRGLWAEEDKTRSTERSRIVTPATTQAVESSVSEIEEATFGHGQLFDIKDDMADEKAARQAKQPQEGQQPQPPENADIAFLRTKLTEDMTKQKVRSAVSEVLINAAVYGTGVAEIVLDSVKEMAPATEPMMEGQLQAVGVNITDRTVVKMRPIQAKNFLIDPVATSIAGAHGCAIDEFVPAHTITQMQEEGVYKQGYVGTAAQDEDIEPNLELDVVPYQDKVRLLKYFGLVPRHLLEKAQGAENEDEEVVDLLVDDEEDTGGSYWVEAIVVIANEGQLVLKCESNPYMMQDRPVVAFQWDIVPGLFWGRGICEKAYNSQKALDAEIRGRIDALALTTFPMLAMDATRIPRGHKPQVRPGKMLLTNGNPREVLTEFNFGSVDQITFAQAGELQKMVQQSTGAVDSSGISGSVNGEATAAGISMSLGAIIKRQKRTLVNFQEDFWIPFIEKSAWRYMQFDPEHYPVSDYNFVATSTLGIMAREYEVTQLVQLLQTTSDQSPMYGALVQAIVDNMNVNNREELSQILMQANQPDPEEEKMKKQMHEQEMRLKEGQISVFEAQANESNMRAEKYRVEAELEPRKVENERIDAVADVRDGVDAAQFQRRLDIANTRLKEKDLNIKEKKVDIDAKNADSDRAASNELNSLVGG